MRRTDRELTDKSDVLAILEKADVCRIALNADGAPYIVPLNFGFVWNETLAFYFHCAAEGRKLDLIARNNAAAFALDTDHELVRGGNGCGWGMKYGSVMGTGTIEVLADRAERTAALDAIMRHYGSTADTHVYEEAVLAKTKVLRLMVREITGKRKK